VIRGGAHERSIQWNHRFAVQPVVTDGRAVLHFATRSLLSWNDLVWHYLVYWVTRVLDRVSESLFTLGVEL
jgi:hypothetical protein